MLFVAQKVPEPPEMMICIQNRHLKQLLTDVYLATFGGNSDSVEIIIRATPRIEISSVEEICQLMESGVVSHENAMDISNMIFGLDLQQGIGKKANAGIFNKTFSTPKNKAALMSAARNSSSSNSSAHTEQIYQKK